MCHIDEAQEPKDALQLLQQLQLFMKHRRHITREAATNI
jgi:hypothetical protein